MIPVYRNNITPVIAYYLVIDDFGTLIYLNKVYRAGRQSRRKLEAALRAWMQ